MSLAPIWKEVLRLKAYLRHGCYVLTAIATIGFYACPNSQ